MCKEILLGVGLLLVGCDKAKVNVNVEAKGKDITVNGQPTEKIQLKKDETGTTVNGQPVDKVDVKVDIYSGAVNVKTAPPPTTNPPPDDPIKK